MPKVYKLKFIHLNATHVTFVSFPEKVGVLLFTTKFCKKAWLVVGMMLTTTFFFWFVFLFCLFVCFLMHFLCTGVPHGICTTAYF